MRLPILGASHMADSPVCLIKGPCRAVSSGVITPGRRHHHFRGAAGGLLAIMGLFDLVGTTASGWLTDRLDPRKLLFAYYGLRGLSLIYLPFANFTFFGLSSFAVFYGLDWIATVPPTLAIANRAFGTKKAPILFGWISANHQVGAAAAAFFAGASGTATGSYLDSFVIAGFVAVAALLALTIGTKGRQMAGGGSLIPTHPAEK
jgi:predicted MFS family arabinose efflux permease